MVIPPRPGVRQRERLSHPLWIGLILAGLVSALVPFDPGSSLATPSLVRLDMPEQFYRFIKSTMLWVPVGLMFGLAGWGNIPRVWAWLLVVGCFFYFGFSLDVIRIEITQEILAVAPGLAAGLWLGEKSRLPDKSGSVATSSIAIEPESAALASADGNSAFNPKNMPPSEDRANSRHHSRSTNKAAISHPVSFKYFRRLLALTLLLAMATALIYFPRWPIVLGAGFVLYLAVLWRYPQAWLLVIPASLPLLDLAPWTGQFFFDEFDFLMLITLAALLWRPSPKPVLGFSPGMKMLFFALCLSVLISGAIGLLPWQPLDANAFSNYLSHYNSVRVAKGFLWGIALYSMLRSSEDLTQAIRLFSTGMVLGLAGVSIAALHEYWLFSGASAPDYRVTATFSSMHIGGGHIEAYLAFALPFAWTLLWQEKRHWIKALALGVFLLAIYALITTVARGGIVALAVALAVLALGVYRTLRTREMPLTLPYTASAALVAGVVLVIAGLSTAPFLQQRFTQTEVDAQTRFTHWAQVLGLLQNNWGERLFGAGLGTFPGRYFYANFDSALGNYRYQTEGNNRYLSLNSGGILYMAQSVAVTPGMPYTLELDVRSNDQTKQLDTPICEKKLFNSHLCQWLSVPVAAGNGWQHQSITFSSGQVGQGAWWARRPVQLSLFNPQDKGVVDVDNIRLLDRSGANLISNGDFAQGGDYWLFKSGNHLPWHTKNMWIHLAFEQGLIGLAIFCILIITAVWRLMRGSWSGDPLATVWLAGISGLLTIGFVDSLLDAPRLAMLLVLALLFGASHHVQRNTGRF